MYYCESCKILCPENCCENCGKKALRTVNNDDFCFFIECPEDQAKMLKEALQEENIPCALIPSGRGVRSALGLNLENMRVFLPYAHLEKGEEIFAGIIPPPLDETEELRALLLENKSLWHTTGFFKSRSLRKKLGLSKDDDLNATLEALIKSATGIRDEGLISSSTVGGHYLIAKTEKYDLTFDSVSFEFFHVKKK
ncbi:MAG: hypothetical protein IJZ37_05295 [Clostridia bacterium]|nr:hypothetical protein [Clostridia bacterium]